MNFHNIENFVFIPDTFQGLKGRLYELEKSERFEKNSFVIIPYQNPQVKNIEPRFFRVKNKISIDERLQNVSQNKIQLKAKISHEEYLKKVHELKSHIQRGNIYEINFCTQFFANDVNINPFFVFQSLNELAKAPYSALVKLGHEFIISASPELFLKKEGNYISTKPIKGTTRRGKNSEEDELLKNALQTSSKERTENVMAVDVARNDLSHFAKKGTVQVNKLYNIETFETVHQMVSTVSCEMKDNTNFENIISASFPMASMTGAPKTRAMQLIDEFENFERHYYSGAMGLINENEDFTLSVNIRSIFYNQKTKHLGFAVGGAITYLSEAEKEYEECLLKAKALLKVLNAEIL